MKKIGWYWDYEDLSAGPYECFEDVVRELGLENDLSRFSSDAKFMQWCRKMGTIIEHRYDTPRGM